MFRIPVLNEFFPVERNMVAVARLHRPIRARRHAGHPPELAVQVRLIAEAAVRRHCRPLDASTRCEPIDDGLEAAHPTESLRCQSDRSAEQLDESLRAVSRLVSDLGNSRNGGFGINSRERVRDRRVHEQRTAQSGNERSLDACNRRLRR